MKRALLISLFVVAATRQSAAIDSQKLADAIYLAEGGPHARVPYGILSVHVHNQREARAVCIRTIENAWTDYSALRAPRSALRAPRSVFIDFLSDRYCPASSDPAGNRHWRHNVQALLK